ncbi:MAG: DNA polymerase-3 subunit alpha [Flavobacteriaceae bacterium]|jgi:DNA polymerase-3 subunit alpha|tara:strand:- start:1928 stop:6307 length:4380 start_codon:yes stop_codon:yes gene_type:complete
MYLIFDTETTGLPKKWNAPISDINNWPRCVQLAWQIHDNLGNCIESKDFLIKPDGYNIPYDSQKIHGISTELAERDGHDLLEVLTQFNEAVKNSKFIIGHNVKFDLNIMGCEFYRLKIKNNLEVSKILDTCYEKTATLCEIPGGRGGKYKFPTLTELHSYLFSTSFADAHNATADVEATTRCFLELIRIENYSLQELEQTGTYFLDFKKQNTSLIQPIGINHVNLKKKSALLLEKSNKNNLGSGQDNFKVSKELLNSNFAHLHNHSQFSVLQSTISIKELIKTTSKHNMPAVALTDHANMMGSFRFVNEVNRYNEQIVIDNSELSEDESDQKKSTIKPILGCEFFVCEDHLNKSYKDYGYQIVLLAKNKNGYQNLAKLSSIAYTKGFYYVPRIDKNLILEYKKDIIVLSGNLYGEIPSKILNIGEKQAEESLVWWKNNFGSDFYLEIMNHNQEDEKVVNEVIKKFSKNHEVKLIATNNNYYSEKQDANAHDILLCVKDGEKQSTPIGRGRGFRYGLPNHEYYYKSSDEMKSLFADCSESITNIQEIIDKTEAYTLARDVLLPKFEIPSEFEDFNDLDDLGKRGENNYLRHLTYEGAKKRYSKLTEELIERLDFELATIEKTGYPGYFLIVEDFIREARNMDVSVGPGRGSAAGSVVAYCLWITNIDPIKYDLLFERFLNPDRVSMPDIDIDFDDEGRGKVMDYVIDKYGDTQVAQIITYGTMAAKSAIRDTARVLDLPLNDADRLAKLVPNMSKLKTIFETDANKLRGEFRPEDLDKVNQLLNISQGDDLEAETITQARILEGSVRNVGTHACGVIITPDDITNFVPVATAKDSNLYVTQFDNSVVEQAGLLKMDFLGLKTLSLIKSTVKIVKAKHSVTLDPDNFPLDDEKTFELFQKGETVGVFQYESAGMQKHLKELKPTVFDDLIAMNALYRPGPMEYIPSFINRKHGDEKIDYDLPEMEEYLKETYGITVYQEQVMLLSQKLADFTKGEADVLRKAMGKKQKSVLDKMKPKFLNQASSKGLNIDKLEKIWKDWEAFASYAFNKSHSTCYAWIAYQTAYLKANYPAEYMAAVLSNNMNDIKSVTFFMEECKRMKLNVLGPDVNESYYKFSVNQKNEIRFGMGAVKGVGANAVATIVTNRKEDGNYNSIFDLAKRIDLRAANKKAFDNLAASGAFDCFSNVHRSQYFNDDGDGITFLEKTIRHASKYQENINSAQVSLFENSSEIQFAEPIIPSCNEWDPLEKLAREKEVVGIYISGHPLDDFKIEMNTFCNSNVTAFKNMENYINKELAFGGILTEVEHRISRQGKGWASFTIEDYLDSYEFRIFGEDYLKFKHFLIINNFLFIKSLIKEGWQNRETGKKSDPRIQFNSFKLLHDVLDSFAKKLSIQLNLNEIDNHKLERLNNIIDSFKGDHRLNFVVYDTEEKIKLDMLSENKKVNISQELLDELDKEKIYFKLN